VEVAVAMTFVAMVEEEDGGGGEGGMAVVVVAAIVITIGAAAVTTATISKTVVTSVMEAAGGWGGEEDMAEVGGIITKEWEEGGEGEGDNHRGGRGEDHRTSPPIISSPKPSETCRGRHNERGGAEDTTQGDLAADY
jgi:hypothetical protein